MKHLGLMQNILIIGAAALLLGTGAGELTAYQSLMPSAEVGQMVTVTVSLTYNGQNSTQAMVTPNLPPGVVANNGGQSLELYPGITQQVSYPLTAQQSGSYWIVSDISYSEDGYPRSLSLEAPFTATEPQVPEPQPIPGGQTPGAFPGPEGSLNPADPNGAPPAGAMPGEENPTGVNGHNQTGEPPMGPQPDGFGGPAGPIGQNS